LICPPQSLLGLKATLQKVRVSQTHHRTLLWPELWADLRGGTLVTPRKGAPQGAYILPLKCYNESSGLPRPDFFLQTEITANAPRELVNVDPSDPAYVMRWLSVFYSITTPLLVSSSAAVVSDGSPLWTGSGSIRSHLSYDILECWFYYPEE
jgi:hypothetical protein